MANNVAVGGLVKAVDYTSLFSALETCRAKHYAGARQTAAGRSALLTQVPTGNPTVNTLVKPDIINTLKTQLQRFKSSFYGNGTHGNNITVPTVGSYIRKSVYDVVYNEVTTLQNRSTADSSYYASCYSYSSDYSCSYSSYDGSYGYGDGSYSSNGSYYSSGYGAGDGSYSTGDGSHSQCHTNYNVSGYQSCSGGSSSTCTSGHCTPKSSGG